MCDTADASLSAICVVFSRSNKTAAPIRIISHDRLSSPETKVDRASDDPRHAIHLTRAHCGCVLRLLSLGGPDILRHPESSHRIDPRSRPSGDDLIGDIRSIAKENASRSEKQSIFPSEPAARSGDERYSTRQVDHFIYSHDLS